MFGIARRNRDEFNLFDKMFEDFGCSCTMPTTCVEKEDRYILSIDVPGIARENIDIKIDCGVCTISATRNEESYGNGWSERKYGKMNRKFNVVGLDADNIDARLENGVLTVEIPKKETAAKINIK